MLVNLGHPLCHPSCRNGTFRLEHVAAQETIINGNFFRRYRNNTFLICRRYCQRTSAGDTVRELQHCGTQLREMDQSHTPHPRRRAPTKPFGWSFPDAGVFSSCSFAHSPSEVARCKPASGDLGAVCSLSSTLLPLGLLLAVARLLLCFLQSLQAFPH